MGTNAVYNVIIYEATYQLRTGYSDELWTWKISPANHYSERKKAYRSQAPFFISAPGKEKLDDWGIGYDICPDCGAKAWQR